MTGQYLFHGPDDHKQHEDAGRYVLSTFYGELKKFDNLLLTGRMGFYNYNNADHCIDMGRFIAESLEAGKLPPVIWQELEQRVKEYRIVD